MTQDQTPLICRTGKFIFKEFNVLPSSILFNLLGRMECGAILLDSERRIEGYNELAPRMLLETSRQEREELEGLRIAVKNILQSGSIRLRFDTESWLLVSRTNKRPLALHAIPAGPEEDPYYKTLVVLIDLDSDKIVKPDLLQDMFGLTPSEAMIAIRLSQGKTPLEIAKEKNVSPWTVRTQLASIFHKTQSRRQSDVVALVLRLSLLT